MEQQRKDLRIKMVVAVIYLENLTRFRDKMDF